MHIAERFNKIQQQTNKQTNKTKKKHALASTLHINLALPFGIARKPLCKFSLLSNVFFFLPKSDYTDLYACVTFYEKGNTNNELSFVDVMFNTFLRFGSSFF